MPLGPSPIAGRRQPLDIDPMNMTMEQVRAWQRANLPKQETVMEQARKLPGRVGAFVGLTGAEARAAPYYLAGLPRGLASALRPRAGERMGGLGSERAPRESRFEAFGRGMREGALRLPGGEGAMGTLDEWNKRADKADLPPEYRFAAGIGAPDVQDMWRIAALKAFQGSPNKWDVHPETGKYGLRADKLGSGEGAHVRGYGHYLAERRGVAKYYQGPQGKVHPYIGGDALDLDNAQHGVAMQVQRWRDTGSITGKDLGNTGLDPVSFETFRKVRMDAERKFIKKATKISPLQDEATNAARRAYHQSVLDEWENVRTPSDALPVEMREGGTLIEGTVDLEYDDMLDLDAPLKDQSPKVRESLESMGVNFGEVGFEVKYAKGLDPKTKLLDPGDLVVHGPAGVADIYSSSKHGGYTIEFPFEETYSSAGTKKEAIEYAKKKLRGKFSEHITGDELRKDLERKFGREGASQVLQDAGIPGSMFHDQGSRWGAPAQELLAKFDGDIEKARAEVTRKLRIIEEHDLGQSQRAHWKQIASELKKERTRNFVVFPGGEHLVDVEKLNDAPITGALSR